MCWTRREREWLDSEADELARIRDTELTRVKDAGRKGERPEPTEVFAERHHEAVPDARPEREPAAV